MHRLPIAMLLELAGAGNIQALITLMGLAVKDKTFIARRAAQALLSIGIKTEHSKCS